MLFIFSEINLVFLNIKLLTLTCISVYIYIYIPNMIRLSILCILLLTVKIDIFTNVMNFFSFVIIPYFVEDIRH